MGEAKRRLQQDQALATGRLPMILANAISDAMAKAMRTGMEPDEAISVALAVVTDYARGSYGDAYALGLSAVIADRVRQPMPESSQ